MATQRFTTEIKTRVTPKQKRALQRLAAEREADVSDLVREAFRRLLESADREKQQQEAA